MYMYIHTYTHTYIRVSRPYRKDALSFISNLSEGRMDIDWRLQVRRSDVREGDAQTRTLAYCRPKILLTHIPLWRPPEVRYAKMDIRMHSCIKHIHTCTCTSTR